MDQSIERMIDEAGREAVFARAEALGWPPGSAVPTWVWQQIAAEVKRGDRGLSVPPKPLHEQVLGFRLF